MKTFSKLFAYGMIIAMAAVGYSCSKDDEKNKGNGSKTPNTDFTYSGHSYRIVTDAKAWKDAAADALAKGGYLVEIGDQAEQNAIYQEILSSGISSTYTAVVDGGGIAYIWIGATDRTTEGGWLWNGANKLGTFPIFWFGVGSAVGGSYVNWGGKASGTMNEPDNFTDTQYAPNGQDAAAIGLAKWPSGVPVELGKAGEWNDIAEANNLYYIIEFNK